jgi:uncharacterized protein (TIGR03437 family)
MSLTGTILPASGPSQPNSILVQNSASDALGLAAPGTWISIFGDQLSITSGYASQPLATLGGTKVQMGSQFLPLSYVSATQVNALVPYGLTPNTALGLTVLRGNVPSVPVQITMGDAAPGVFTINQAGTGQGAIFNGVTNVLADSNAPVSAGDVITIYCTGLGDVNNAPVSGMPAPGAPNLATTIAAPSLSIAGVAASVSYSGLVPGFVGLYQINAPVPGGVAPGNAVPVVITVEGINSNTATIAVQ